MIPSPSTNLCRKLLDTTPTKLRTLNKQETQQQQKPTLPQARPGRESQQMCEVPGAWPTVTLAQVAPVNELAADLAKPKSLGELMNPCQHLPALFRMAQWHLQEQSHRWQGMRFCLSFSSKRHKKQILIILTSEDDLLLLKKSQIR